MMKRVLNPQYLRLRSAEIAAYAAALTPGRKLVGTRFVIFAQGRTGTWLLRQLLNMHPQIVCDKEILMPRRLSPYLFLEGRSRQERSVYGFHAQISQLLQTHHISPAAFLRQLDEDGWRIIYLRRQNILRQSISSMIAERRRLWHTANPADLPDQRFQIDLDELMAWLERRQHYHSLESQSLQGLPHLSLVYEKNLLPNSQHQTTMNQVFAFLNLQPVAVEAQLKRLSGDNLSDSVANYQELVNRVITSPYQEYLV